MSYIHRCINKISSLTPFHQINFYLNLLFFKLQFNFQKNSGSGRCGSFLLAFLLERFGHPSKV